MSLCISVNCSLFPRYVEVKFTSTSTDAVSAYHHRYL